MRVFDAHTDALTGREDLSTLTQRLNDGHWDLVRFAEGGGRWQIAAIFTPPKFVGVEALAYALHHLARILEWVEQHRQRVRLILRRRDLTDDGRIGLLLSLEGASPLMGREEFLRLFFRLGIRCLTLTWNHRNELADGVGVGDAAGGITETGETIVSAGERVGLAFGGAPLSEGRFLGADGALAPARLRFSLQLPRPLRPPAQPNGRTSHCPCPTRGHCVFDLCPRFCRW